MYVSSKISPIIQIFNIWPLLVMITRHMHNKPKAAEGSHVQFSGTLMEHSHELFPRVLALCIAESNRQVAACISQHFRHNFWPSSFVLLSAFDCNVQLRPLSEPYFMCHTGTMLAPGEEINNCASENNPFTRKLPTHLLGIISNTDSTLTLTPHYHLLRPLPPPQGCFLL